MNAALATAVQYLKTRLPSTPAVGVILGSGLGDFADSLDNPTTIGYEEIPEFPRSAVVGHAGKLYFGVVDQVPVVVLSGRIHYYEGHSMSSVVFPARVLARLGCRTVIVTNAAGGINTRYKSGDLMLISDHINAFGANPLMGPNDDDLGPRFPDMSDAYRKDLREVARRAAETAGVKLQEGVYVGVHGPSYETPAEIRSLRTWGADAVGMSTVPEAIALNQMGVGVVGLSCITNMAAGVLPQKLDHKEVLETTQRVKGEIVRFLRAMVAALGPTGEPDARGAQVGREER
jgi:purine-nucleoside phosphorylase